MENKTLFIERTFQATFHQVWQAIADKDTMKQWYFDFESFQPEEGFEFHFFVGTEDKQYRHKCKITEVLKEKNSPIAGVIKVIWAYPLLLLNYLQ